MVFGAVVTAFVLGFLAGLFAFKLKSRWCPECGAMTKFERPQTSAATVNQGRY
jgi:hypothetical protein